MRFLSKALCNNNRDLFIESNVYQNDLDSAAALFNSRKIVESLSALETYASETDKRCSGAAS